MDSLDLPPGIRGEGDTLSTRVRLAPTFWESLRRMALLAVLMTPALYATRYVFDPTFAERGFSSHAASVLFILLGVIGGWVLSSRRFEPTVAGRIRLTPTHLEVGSTRYRLDSLIGVTWEDEELEVNTLGGPHLHRVHVSEKARVSMVQVIEDRLRERGDVQDVPPELRRVDRRPRLFQHLR